MHHSSHLSDAAHAECIANATHYLDQLCCHFGNRCVGTQGNQGAVDYVKQHFKHQGLHVEETPFDAMNWQGSRAFLEVDTLTHELHPSPYSLGCDITATLVAVDTVEKLKTGNFTGKIILLYGDIAKEQLIPKNFIFSQLPEHQEIIQLLENSGALGLICTTGMNASMAGGVYPFPLIEDGDFNIPSTFTKDIDVPQLLKYQGKPVRMFSDAKREIATGSNLLARKGNASQKRIVVSAHIDTKQNTPGAIDNATGVVVLMLLSEMIKHDPHKYTLDFVVFNGEDYYSVPGQMQYLKQNVDHFDVIQLNINIDCAGYAGAPTAFSPMNLSEATAAQFTHFLHQHPEICRGIPWYQGDHSLFLQNGCPAIAVASQWFIDHLDSQDITHTPKDAPEIVDIGEVVNIAYAIRDFLTMMS